MNSALLLNLQFRDRLLRHFIYTVEPKEAGEGTVGAGQSSGRVKAKSPSCVEDLRLINLCVNGANWPIYSNDKGKKILQIGKLDNFLSPPHTGKK